MGLRRDTNNSAIGDPDPFLGGYSWWVYPNVVKHNGLLFVSYCNNQGLTMIGSLDLATNQQTEFSLQYCGTDEHNTAAICIMPDDHLLVAYSKHGTESATYVRKSASPNSIASFEEPIVLQTSGKATYAQLVYLPRVRRYYLFYRIDSRHWVIRWSDDGLSWSSEVVFVKADVGQYYMRIAPCGDAQIKIVTVAHPINNPDHTLRLMVLDALDGCLRDKNGNVLAKIGELDAPLLNTMVPTICEAAPGHSLRLFDVCNSPSGACTPARPGVVATAGDSCCDAKGAATFTAAVFASWTSDRDCVYRVVRGSGDNWIVSTVCSAGKPIEEPAGGNFYFGGAWFEPQDDKTAYIAREDSCIWKIERYTTKDYVSWDLAEVIAIDTVNKLHRPCVPFGGNGDWLVWQRGKYTSFTRYESTVVGRAW